MNITRLRGTNITPDNLTAIVNTVSIRYSGNIKCEADKSDRGLRFRLFAADSSGDGARRSWSGRRTRSACWHVHRDVLRAVFDAAPDIRIRTMYADYNGVDGFESAFPDTYDTQVGSMVAPAYAGELCNCGGPNARED